MIRPRATYRVQLRPEFGLREAAGIVPYLASLGVSHMYTSPLLQAVRGSAHGYDVVDHSRVSEELGGEEGFEALVTALKTHGMGLLVDIVPNHMAIDPADRWWWDVLENGRSSLYALFFDVSWDPPEEKLREKILLPDLGGHYGRELEAGALRVERRGGRILLTYGDRIYPLAPETLAGVVDRAAERAGSSECGEVARAFSALQPIRGDTYEDRRVRHNAKEAALERLARECAENDAVVPAIDREVARLNGDPDALDDLLQRQHYRLAFWRTGARELDYRRFFDINDLVGLRVEDPVVFDAVHERVIGWVRQGKVDGVRVDHVDGLRDPAGYLDRLRSALGPDAWIVVEKVLHHEERLRSSWQVDGTTGYEVIDLIGGAFVDPQGETPLTESYARFTGETRPFLEVAREAKLEVLRTLLTADVERVTALLVRACELHRRQRDHTRDDLRHVVRELAAALAVYRTYARADADVIEDEDRRWIDGAVGTVRRVRPDIDVELLRFVRSLLLLEIGGEIEHEFVMRFQQLTAPATAKGIEDTALYRWSRFVARNEVGVDPGRFSVRPDELHRASRERLAQTSRGLTALSTHDTKRSADVRARLALISEIPAKWSEALRRWSQRNERHRTGEMPSREDEHLFYQTLVGAYPLSIDRALAYMEKAAREAKRSTSWTAPDEKYERALAAIVHGALTDDAFIADLETFVAPLVAAGRITSLAHTLVQCALPGVPDIYQGNELWDLSLVDPDSRRLVDFEARRALVADLDGLDAEAVIERMDDGLPKLHVIRRALEVRKRWPADFERGPYAPLPVSGAEAHRVIAFSRGDRVAVIVPRLVLGLRDWGDTSVSLPEGEWCDELASRPRRGGAVPVRELFATFPVALLTRETPGA